MKVSEQQPFKLFSYYSLSLPLGWRALWRCPEDVDSERWRPGNLKNVQKAAPRFIVYTKHLSCQRVDRQEGLTHGQTEKKTKVKEETQKGKWKSAEASGYWWRDSLFIWCELRTSAGWFTLLPTSMVGQETEDVGCSGSQPFCLFDKSAGIGPLNAELFGNSFHHITSGLDLLTWCQNEPFQPVI